MRSNRRAPSYLPAQRFVAALIDTLGTSYGSARAQGDFVRTASALPSCPLRDNLQLIVAEAGGDLARVRQGIERWYDDVMQRVSGWYKRQTQWMLLAIAFVLAVAMNVDSIELGKRLWTDPVMREVAVRSARIYVEQAAAGKPDERKPDAEARAKAVTAELDALRAREMPIGWPLSPEKRAKQDWGDWALALSSSFAGWLLTALAVSLGAPYWYDVLLRLLPMSRAAGARPEPSTGKAAAPGAASPSAATATAEPRAPFQYALNEYEATSLTTDDVREVQKALGLSGAGINGLLDQATREAIKAKQRTLGLSQTGELNAGLVRELLGRRRGTVSNP
jgi:hypothetical protein